MKQKVAVESDLTPFKNYLDEKGYNAEMVEFSDLSASDAAKYDAFIISGINKDFMGMQDIKTKAPVIDVKGMTPEQAFNELKSVLS